MAEKPRVATFYGGVPEDNDIKLLKDPNLSPHIVVGTPGRVKGVRITFDIELSVRSSLPEGRLKPSCVFCS